MPKADSGKPPRVALHQPKGVDGPVAPDEARQPVISLLDALKQHRFDEQTCFLCGTHLAGHAHDEHVFPKWLQRRYNLTNETISLLNRTTIPYRQLKIPCCAKCNNENLSRVETAVKKALSIGYAGIRSLKGLTLFLWLNKIFFGLLYRELLLPFDRKARNSGPILNDLKPFELVHYFIQALRLPMTFQSADHTFPGTLFLFNLQAPSHPRARFDFRDDVVHRCIYMRVDDVGLLAAFDAGAQAVGWGHFFKRYGRCKLHPQQFEELGARFFYNARLMNRSPATILADSGPSGRAFVFVGPIAGVSSRPVFDVGNASYYAKMLSAFVGAPLDVLLRGNQVMTFLHKEDDRFLRLDLRRKPYRGVH